MEQLRQSSKMTFACVSECRFHTNFMVTNMYWCDRSQGTKAEVDKQITISTGWTTLHTDPDGAKAQAIHANVGAAAANVPKVCALCCHQTQYSLQLNRVIWQALGLARVCNLRFMCPHTALWHANLTIATHGQIQGAAQCKSQSSHA
eukprot:6491537-Amphidinium_carterae.7